MPEVAAKRRARSMRISIVRIPDPWANRKLAICTRSFKALAAPGTATGGAFAPGGAMIL
jgi:hypothetical protein